MVFPTERLAVFLDGCFWHGCPQHATWPALHAAISFDEIVGRRRLFDLCELVEHLTV